MEEVRFEDYKGKERQTTRFFHNDSDAEEMPTLVKAGVGLVAAAGLLRVGHQSGAIRKIASFLDIEAKSTFQAVREILDESGQPFRENGRITANRISKIKEGFVKVQDRRGELIQERRKASSNVLSSREMDMERYLRQRDRLIGKIGSDPTEHKGDVPFHIQEGFRYAAVMDDIRASNKFSSETIDTIDQAFTKGRLGILRSESDESVNYLLKTHGITDSDTVKEINDIRRQYAKTDFLLTNDDARLLAEGMQKKLRKFTAQHIQDITKKDGLLKRARIGHKQATVEDILKLSEANKVKIDQNLQRQLKEVMEHNNSFKDTVFDENLYLSTKNGELIDYKAFSDIRRRTAEWWSNTIPGGLLHLRDILNVKEAREQASFRIFQRGSVQSSLNAHRNIENTEALSEEVVFINGKFVKLFDWDAVNPDKALEILNPKRDMYLTSSQFGTTGKIHRHLSGLMTDNEEPRGIIKEALDLGRQDKDAVLPQAMSVFTKFFKKEWEPNHFKKAFKNGVSNDEYFQFNTYFKLNTQGLTPRALNQLEKYMPRHIKDLVEENEINFSREEDMIKLFKAIGKKEEKRQTTQHTGLRSLYHQLERNPDEVLNRKTPIGESNPIIGHHTNVQTGADVIHQQTSLYIIEEILKSQNLRGDTLKTAANFRQTLRHMHGEGDLYREDLDKAENLLNYSMFRSQSFDILSNQRGALDRVSDLFQGDQNFQQSMKTMISKTNPFWERHSSIKPINHVEDEYLAVNKTGVGQHLQTLFGINAGIKERANAVGDIAKQLSPFTGRNNMEDVTTLSIYGANYPLYRLQDALGNVNLGFSDASMGSPMAMFSSLMMKRIFPVYGGVEGAKYADWKVDQWTGEGIDERWENYKANQRIDQASSRTPEDIYQANRQRMLKPGIEHFEATPSFHLPIMGEFGAGNVLNSITSPFMVSAPLHEEDTMSLEETYDDLFHGTEEIRKSRWWFAGSKSAYRGDRITEFAPNSFRRAHSDYEWSGTSATGEEYWGNHILPTFENPLGLVAHAIGERDPYWYERKHYYDRPYLLTGELFNPNTLVLGDIGNVTIGRLIKPVKEMHPEYWGDPVLIYDEETKHLGDRPKRPIRTTISPAGRTEYDVLATPREYGAETNARYITSDELDDEGNVTGGYVATDLETNESIYVPANIAQDLSYSEAFSQAREEAPQGSSVRIVSSSSDNPSYQVQVSTQPRGMMDQEYAYRQDIMYRKMTNIKDPRDSSWRIQEGIENWSEPLGVYKWIVGDELLGRDPYGGKTVIQRADASYNASNRFWESELGSLGSQMSEIGRRFIRRDDGMLETYNPVRNTMPDWLPGDDYFINFQIGDPYEKLPNGERRLPGEAYESLNQLHSDETGRYGAFDKFKILADVAPFSDEYNFWSKYLLDTLEEGSDLRKEATQIRKQVSQRRQKFEFTPYRFKGNNVVYDEVTVDRFLDDYTFLAKELGDQPIRVAGVEYRKNADGVLQSYFQEGDKIVIGVDEDPRQRIAKDTYGTMRAVIHNEIGNINKRIIERGQMVENQNDFSAPGVHSRFTPQEIRRGERWETVAHASSPLNTKFLQVRTAVEEYERDQIYGKHWATWENFMMDDYVIPALEGLGRFENPLWSMTAGATTGLVLGRFFLKGGKPTKIASIAGALLGLGSNMFFKNHERKHGEAWTPERRRTEHDINEYFDILTFLKNEGLYQKAREEIIHTTGYDVEDFSRIIEDRKKLTKERRKELSEEKKQLFIDQPNGWEERHKEINAELKTISENKSETFLPESFMQALEYKKKRDTTLYGVDPFDDRMEVMQAFPYKDKYFFTSFVEADEEEREKILKLVPENQRRIYKALWGMGLEEQKPLEHYMQKYDIPDWDWEGWKPEYNLDDIKVKAVQEAGIDMTDFNFWDDDIAASQYTPDLQSDGNTYQGEPPDSFEGYNQLRQNIANVLQGRGLHDVQVVVKPSNGSETNVNIRYTEDRQKEIEEHLRRHADSYV